MSRALWAVGGAGLGAGLMYLADPRSGHWRRVHAHDKALHVAHGAGDAAQLVARDMVHRSRGLYHELRGRMRPETVDDATLEARVRAALGRVCSHPHSVRVRCNQGRVFLEGAILVAEHRRLLGVARRVRGVASVHDHLKVHPTAAHHPELQGGRRRVGHRSPLLQRHWSPSTRFLAVVGGAGLMVLGSTWRGLLGPLVGGAGAVLGLRGLTNLELRRLTGLGAGRQAIAFHKDLRVDAPLEAVFAFWSAMENFPRFMGHVQEVRRLAEDLWHWKVHGPAGTSFQWDAVVTRFEPNHLLEWKSVEGATIENAGSIHFQREGEGRTRLDIRLSYNPPAGAIGHAFARLLGADPKLQMDDDLLRFKTLLERGRALTPSGSVPSAH
ncbi:SRPBCC family protein [Myxococcaceae bacterium GXIMD 01537]